MNARNKDRKYPLATMAVGETVVIETATPTKYFRHNVYVRARVLNRRFTTLQIAPGKYEVRRIDGLPDEDKLSRSRLRSSAYRAIRKSQEAA